MKGVERVVQQVLNHQEELSNFGRLAAEVYIAYILERVIEHFHTVIGVCLGRFAEKIKEEWEAIAGEVLPNILEKIKKLLATLLQTAKSLRKKVCELLHRVLRDNQP